MEIKVVHIVIHDATVDRYVLASQKKHQCAVGGVRRCCDHDHLLRCGQTVVRVLKAFQCIYV